MDDVTTGDIEIQRQDHHHLICRCRKIRMGEAERGDNAPGADDKRSEITRRGFCISHLRAVAVQLWRGQRLRAKHGNHLPSAHPSASCDGTRCWRGTSCEVVCQRTGSIPSALQSANKRNKGLCHSSIVLGRTKL